MTIPATYLHTLPGNYDTVCFVPRVFRFVHILPDGISLNGFPGYHITFLTSYDRETTLQYKQVRKGQ